MCIGLAPRRIACHGICATSRFHSARRGCVFGCPNPDDERMDLDDALRCSVCPRWKAILMRWLGQ
eukprot:3541735-Pyramimonas_sp.AAC.1